MSLFEVFFAAEQTALVAYGVTRLCRRRSQESAGRGASYDSQSRERMEVIRTTTDLLALSDAPARHEREREIAEHEHAARLARALRARAEAECEQALAAMRLAAVTEPDDELRGAQRRLELVLAERRIATALEAAAANGPLAGPAVVPTRRRMRGRPEVLPDNYHYADHDENGYCASEPSCEPVDA